MKLVVLLILVQMLLIDLTDDATGLKDEIAGLPDTGDPAFCACRYGR